MRRAQRVLLVLRVELGDDLARLEDVADIDEPLDHASVEAEREADLVLGANLARQRHGLAFRAALDGDGPNRPDLGGGGRLLVAAREGSRDQDGRCSSETCDIGTAFRRDDGQTFRLLAGIGSRGRPFACP